jgi:hypothetical protein
MQRPAVRITESTHPVRRAGGVGFHTKNSEASTKSILVSEAARNLRIFLAPRDPPVINFQHACVATSLRFTTIRKADIGTWLTHISTQDYVAQNLS